MIYQHIMTLKMENGMKFSCHNWVSRLKTVKRCKSEMEVDVQTESIKPHVPEAKITTFKDAIIALEDVQNFLESRGHISTSMTYIGPAVDTVTSLQIASMRQGTLHDYYTSN